MTDRSQDTPQARVEARLERIARELDSPGIRNALAVLKAILATSRPKPETRS